MPVTNLWSNEMTDEHASDVEQLSISACWALLHAGSVGRLAVWVEDHPEIFPLNYAVDHGSLVFRSAEGTKLSGALSDVPVALEIDGYDEPTAEAWSVVVKGRAERIEQIQDLMDTVDLPLFPWQAGPKNRFIRILPAVVTGRRFPVADPSVWRTPLSEAKRSSME